MGYTSAVCVLVGSETWLRRWVRYEIARAVIDELGLLAVHINSIRHHQRLTTDALGPNPFEYMAVGKVQDGALSPVRYYLFEKKVVHRYDDHTDSVKLPRWLNDPPLGYVMPLSTSAGLFDHVANDGHKNIGLWIDRAAQAVGR